MLLWTSLVDMLHTLILGLAATFGGNLALTVGVVSLVFRLALLPLTFTLACRAQETRAKLKKLAPELDELKKRFADDPRRLYEETKRLQERSGIRMLDPKSLLGAIFQAPFFVAIYQAVQRLSELAKPEPLLALACAVLAAASAAIAPEPPKPAALLIPAIVTLVFLWRMSSGVVIFSLASSLVGLGQAALVRRRFMAGDPR